MHVSQRWKIWNRHILVSYVCAIGRSRWTRNRFNAEIVGALSTGAQWNAKLECCPNCICLDASILRAFKSCRSLLLSIQWKWIDAFGSSLAQQGIYNGSQIELVLASYIAALVTRIARMAIFAYVCEGQLFVTCSFEESFHTRRWSIYYFYPFLSSMEIDRCFWLGKIASLPLSRTAFSCAASCWIITLAKSSSPTALFLSFL